MSRACIMVVEDEPILAADLRAKLMRFGYTVPEIVPNGEVAVRLASAVHPDLLLMDIRLSGELDGVETARRIRQQLDVPVIYLSAYADDTTLQRTKETEPYGYLLKPLNERELELAIELALENHARQRDLSEREEHYRLMAEYTYDWEYWIDEDGRLSYISPSCARITGYAPNEFLDDPALLERIIHPDDIDRFRDHMLTMSGAGDDTLDFRIITRGQEIRWINHVCQRIVDREGRQRGRHVNNRDITDRQQAKEELRRSEQRLAVTLSSIGDGVIATDCTGSVVLMNPVAEVQTGWTVEEARGRPLREILLLVHERSRARRSDPVEEVLRTKKVVALSNHTLLIARDGTERVLEDSAAPICSREGEVIGVVLVLRDATAKRQLEIERRKAEKLESLSTLARGIAHDYNNILSAILANVSLAQLYAPADHRIVKKLADAEKATYRARDLTQQLLAFARGGAPIKKASSVADVIRDTVAFALTGSSIRESYILAPDLWPVMVDQAQFSQVIGILVMNAKYAMPEGGTLSIEARNIEVNDGEMPALAPGPYVHLLIRDSGAGIPDEIAARIFDPYFTLKDGVGGLELAVCYSIIKNHDGLIGVHTEPGKGAVFSLYLPASPMASPAGAPTPPDELPITCEGRILILEDDADVRAAVEEIVRALGFDAVTVADSDAMLARYRDARETGAPYALVITDLTIRGDAGGKEAAARVLAYDPAALVIVATGHAADPILTEYRRYGFAGAVAKPFDCRTLHAVIRTLVEKRNAGGR